MAEEKRGTVPDQAAKDEGAEGADVDGTGGRRPAREDAGRPTGYHGDSEPESPTAPASAGLAHAEGGGVVDPRSPGPDVRPGEPNRVPVEAQEDTPVRSPAPRGEKGTASAAGASALAGRGAPDEETGGTAEEGESTG